MFTTERLRLRAYSEIPDKASISKLLNDASSHQFLNNASWWKPPSQAEITEYITTLEKTQFFAVIVTNMEQDDAQERFVGIISLKLRVGRNSNIMISLAPSERGKGYAAEALEFVTDHAFKALGCHRISCTMHGNNPRALKLFGRIGFVLEGRIRKGLWENGRWEDTLRLGILEEEWFGREGQH